MVSPPGDDLPRPADSDAAPGSTAEVAGSGPRRDTKRPKYGKLAKQGVAWSFAREGVSELLTTPTALVMARLLTPFDFGIAALAGFFLTLATRLTNFGFNQALVRVKVLRPEHCSSVFVVNIIVGVAAYAVLVSASGLMADFFRAEELEAVIPVAALTFLISPFGTVPAALMSRNMLFRRTALTDWGGGLAEAVSAIYFAWTGHGYWSIVYARVISHITTATLKVALGGWRPSLRFSFKALGELFSFGSGVFAKRLLDYAANNLDSLVIGRVLGVAPLGFYDKAYTTMNKVLIRTSHGGPMVSFRVFSLIYEEPDRFRRAFRKVVLASMLISSPLLLGLAAIGPELIVVMYGERWQPSVLPFQILCVAGALKVFIEYAGSAIQAMGRVWGQVSRQGVYTGLVVVLVAGLSPWGLSGAALGVLLATVAMTVLMAMLLLRLTAIPVSDVIEPQVPGLVAALAVAGAVVGSRRLAVWVLGGAPAWQLLLIEAMAGVLMYVLYLKLNRFREVRALLRDTADDLSPSIGRMVRLLA